MWELENRIAYLLRMGFSESQVAGYTDEFILALTN